MNVKKLKQEKRWLNKDADALFEAVVALKTKREAERFLRDLLTEAEIREFANRWKVAQMLDERIPYTEIEKKTGMSSATIARIASWLKDGMGGYRLMLNRLAHHHTSLSLREG